MPKNAPKSAFAPSSYHRRRLEALRPALAFEGGSVAAWQTTLRAKIRELLGYDRQIPAPLAPQTLWRKPNHPLGIIEKVTYTCEPDADAVAYVCLPRDVEPPYDFWICLQGHTTGAHLSIGGEFKNEEVPVKPDGDRDFGLQCMARGMAAICLEQRAFGERSEPDVTPYWSGCHAASMHALSLGQTLLGERVFDVQRTLDYLATRGDAKMDRVGVMGNSGGGTVAIFAAALLPNLAFAMPSCSFCVFSESIMNIHHCVDNYVPDLMRWCDCPDVMGLFAPRPVTLVAGRDDDIFPLDGVREAFAKLQAIYRAAGAPDACRLVVGTEAHRFYADDAWPEMQRLMNP